MPEVENLLELNCIGFDLVALEAELVLEGQEAKLADFVYFGCLARLAVRSDLCYSVDLLGETDLGSYFVAATIDNRGTIDNIQLNFRSLFGSRSE